MCSRILYLFLLLTLTCPTQAQENFKDDLKQATGLLKRFHFNGNPKFPSTSVFAIQVANIIDGSNLLFNESDFKELIQKYPNVEQALYIDADNFTKEWISLTDKALLRNKQFMQSFFSFVATVKTVKDLDALNYFPESTLQKNEEDQRNALIYNECINMVEEWLNENGTIVLEANTDIQQLVTRYIQKVKRVSEAKSRFLSVNNKELVSLSLKKAFLTYCDPHTNWMSTEEFNSFVTALSQEEKTFGISCIENKNNKLIINKINPASQVAILNLLKQGDEIEIIETEKNRFETPTLYDWYTIQKDEKISKIKLIVNTGKKLKQTVEVERQTFENVDNIVRGFVLTGQAQIGYIALPSFFASWETEGNNKTISNALAKEIVKLKLVGIKGLILDFRNNSGGSVDEAMELLSMFTDSGPMFQYQFKNDEGKLLEKVANDFVRGRVFNLPIVVLVNENSASASEIFAASLQAQGAALIAGNRTYGKGTFQSIIPLYDNPTNTEYLSITNGVFFTNRGTTYQGKGVIPDVIFPSIIENSNTREEDLQFYIDVMPIKTLPEKMPRFTLPQGFGSISKTLEQKVNDINTLQLTKAEGMVNKIKKAQRRADEIQKLYYPNLVCQMGAIPSAQDKDLMKTNPAFAIAIKEQEKEITNDPFIQQTYLIINQLIPLWK